MLTSRDVDVWLRHNQPGGFSENLDAGLVEGPVVALFPRNKLHAIRVTECLEFTRESLVLGMGAAMSTARSASPA